MLGTPVCRIEDPAGLHAIGWVFVLGGSLSDPSRRVAANCFRLSPIWWLTREWGYPITNPLDDTNGHRRRHEQKSRQGEADGRDRQAAR